MGRIQRGLVLKLRQSLRGRQPKSPPVGGVRQQSATIHAYNGQELVRAEEGAILDQPRVGRAVDEAAMPAPRFESKDTVFSRLHRIVEAQNPVAVILVFVDQARGRHREAGKFKLSLTE